ncbi:Rha family transcriptional regulator, partial [Ochrobactrum sp. SFR4]|uniref:Rha family transcriptional regulator n=1 Tax=Ochrobactrum sp. SFR4 TaxID=2717368 RepID=UPI001C8C2F24
EIADLTGSTHDNVLKTIRALVKKGVVSGNETPYVHPQNGQTYKQYELDYRNTMIVVSGYNVELRARIIDRWMALEESVKNDPLAMLSDPAAMRGILLSYTEKVIELESRIEADKPKTQFFDQFMNADGLYGLLTWQE